MDSECKRQHLLWSWIPQTTRTRVVACVPCGVWRECPVCCLEGSVCEVCDVVLHSWAVCALQVV